MEYVTYGGTLKYGDLLGGFLKFGDLGTPIVSVESYPIFIKLSQDTEYDISLSIVGGGTA